MRNQSIVLGSLALGIGAAVAVSALQAQPLSWSALANNATLIPGTALTFNSFNQPSVNASGLVVFRARSKADSAAPVHGIYAFVPSTNPKIPPSVVKVTARGDSVPQPNNTLYNGALAGFEEFPSTPRIDVNSPLIATRGQSQPVYEYQIGIDATTGSPLTTKVGTSGIYTNPGGTLVTGASLLGAVTGYPGTTLTFPQFAVPGAPAGTRFDQFPGGPAATNGTIIAFKGNYTNPSDSIGRTGVYFRDVVASQGKAPVQLVASSDTVIPNPPGAPTVKFGSTAPPSAANGYMVFTGLDIEEAPTRGGIYRAPLQSQPPLQTLAGIGDQVPGEAPGTGFVAFGEGLSISADARYVSFWGTWGTETFSKTLYCPADGNADLLAYCNTAYPSGNVVAIPVHQGIFVADATTGKVYAIAKTQSDGFNDFLYWVFSGRPPGTGGGDEPTLEPPRWRSSAFSALSGAPGLEPQTAFKAAKTGFDGIYLRQGRRLTSHLVTIVETLHTTGTSIDPLAPANSIVTAVGIERDGFRNGNLAITVSMLYDDPVTPLGWAGLYLTKFALLPMEPDPATVTLASSPNPSGTRDKVTFTATVVGAAPTGTVAFADSGVTIGACSAQRLGGAGDSRITTCLVSRMDAGMHSITAAYSGDRGNGAAASEPLLQEVTEVIAAPTVVLASSLNPSATGARVTFTATVVGTAPTGTVGFYDGGIVIAGCGAQPLIDSAGSRIATCVTAKLVSGTHSVTGTYSGDRGNSATTSAPLLQVVTSTVPATTVALASSLNPSTVGTRVTFTATLVANAPRGTVAFTDDGIAITGCGAVPVAKVATGYAARCATSSLPAGMHAIVASYSGDDNNPGSISEALPQVVR